MAFTNLTFPFGSKLTSTQLNQIQGNFTALVEQATDAPEMKGINAAYVIIFSVGQAQVIDGKNVSSVTFAGDSVHSTYTINWSKTFSSANYCTNFQAVSKDGRIGRNFNLMNGPNKTTTTMDVYARLSDEDNTQGTNPQQIFVMAWESR
jgi:hypothetical protein|tara:strand:- start:635 stop:1081 length:447 start_codon:yes stop_codon:yes gene_type:complete